MEEKQLRQRKPCLALAPQDNYRFFSAALLAARLDVLVMHLDDIFESELEINHRTLCGRVDILAYLEGLAAAVTSS